MSTLEELVIHRLQNVNEVLSNDGHEQYAGYVDGEEQYKEFLTDLNTLGFTFYSRSTTNNKSSRILLRSIKKNAEINIPFMGVPFLIVRSTYFSCTRDGRYDPKIRQPVRADEPPPKKSRKPLSKKIGCPAFMTVKCLRIFDDDCYKLDKEYKAICRKKGNVCKKLQDDLHSSDPPTGFLRFMILISTAEQHNHAINFSDLNETLDPRLKREILNLVSTQNVCCVQSVRIHLDDIMKKMFEGSAPPQSDSVDRCYRYYPSDEVVRFHIYQALFAVKQNWKGQESLEEFINTWEKDYPDDNFLFRPFQILTGNEEDMNLEADPTSYTFLFCHQKKWQVDLLNRYGNDISLLDAAFKTCKYSFPLYFLIVKTNVGYCIVGTFIVHQESSELIEEALSQFQTWNPDWMPKYFLTDHSDAGINAIQQMFPETTVYISVFHRNQAWKKWLNSKGNVNKKGITRLREVWHDIASAITEEIFVQKLQEMNDNEMYITNTSAQTYFLGEWLPIHNKWVKAYFSKDFIFMLNVNNGIVMQEKFLTHTYLKTIKYKTLSGIVKAILDDILPDAIEKYSAANTNIDLESNYVCEMPELLNNRTKLFTENVLQHCEEGKLFDTSNVTYMGDMLFMVGCDVTPGLWYPVDFQEPSCSCSFFCEWQLPCKHLCAIFNVYKDWGFSKLPLWYKESPFLNIDTNFCVLHETPSEDDGYLNELRKELRDVLKSVEGYSHLQHDPENILKFINTLSILREDMFLSATQASVELLPEFSEPEPCEHSEPLVTLDPNEVQSSELESFYELLPLPESQAIETSQDISSDKWYQWTSEMIDVVPVSLNQYIENIVLQD